MIWYIVGHLYTQFHANIHMQTKVIAILSFGLRLFWFLMDAITQSGNASTHFIMIKYTVGHKYKNSHANIRNYNKVIKILSFQWLPLWKFKMEVISRVFISYMILTIQNYQYTKFHATIQNGGHYCNQITCLHFWY